MRRGSHLSQSAVRRPLRPPPRLAPPPSLAAVEKRQRLHPAGGAGGGAGGAGGGGFQPVGNRDAWATARAFLRDPWPAGGGAPVLVLAGPCGSGKTYGVRGMAEELGYHVYEVDACEACRAPAEAAELLGAARRGCMAVSADGTPSNAGRPLVLLDDADTYPPEVVAALLRVLRRGAGDRRLAPVVCTCDGGRAPAFRQLKAIAAAAPHLWPVGVDAMVAEHRRLLGAGAPAFLESTVRRAAEAARGDLRQFRARLLLARRGLVDTSAPDWWPANVFRLTEQLLAQPRAEFGRAGAPAEVAEREDGGGAAPDMLFENYARAVADIAEAAAAAEAYSQADLLRHPASRRRLGPSASLALAAVRARRCSDVRFAETLRPAPPRPDSALARSYNAERGGVHADRG